MNNVLVQDNSGTSLSNDYTKPLQAVSNWDIAKNYIETCDRSEKYGNYHRCFDTDFAILAFENTAHEADRYHSKTVRVQGDGYDNNIWALRAANATKSANASTNPRLDRYYSLIHLNKEYNIDYDRARFASRYKIQSRRVGGEADIWMVGKIKFSNSMAVQVLVGGKRIIKADPRQHLDLTNGATACGEYNHDRAANSVSFRVTGAAACIVNINQVNSVELRFDLSIGADDFFKGDLHSNFINKICAFWGISTDKLKIVGISDRKPKTGALRNLASSSSQTEGSTVIVSYEQDQDIATAQANGSANAEEQLMVG